MSAALFHHLSIGVRDLERAARFHDAVLAALGFRRVFEDEDAIGYGVQDEEDLLCLKLRAQAQAPGEGTHLAFAAPSRAAVDAFHAAGMAAGGTDNGAPGARPEYGETYYAAFLIDPDGWHIEAVCKGPASAG